MPPKKKTKPLSVGADISTKTLISALRLENRQLHAKLVKITADNLTLKRDVVALNKENKKLRESHVDRIDLAGAIRDAKARVSGLKT